MLEGDQYRLGDHVFFHRRTSGVCLPDEKGEKQSDYYIHFDTNKDEIVSRMISGEGWLRTH